jgi:trehalose-6-phosphatase
VQEGLKAFEIFSDARWNKGQAALKLRRRYRARNIFYVGDDATDETVFRVLGRSDVGVHVGRGPSQADYFMNRQSKITTLLQRILT